MSANTARETEVVAEGEVPPSWYLEMRAAAGAAYRLAATTGLPPKETSVLAAKQLMNRLHTYHRYDNPYLTDDASEKFSEAWFARAAPGGIPEGVHSAMAMHAGGFERFDELAREATRAWENADKVEYLKPGDKFVVVKPPSKNDWQMPFREVLPEGVQWQTYTGEETTPDAKRMRIAEESAPVSPPDAKRIRVAGENGEEKDAA